MSWTKVVAAAATKTMDEFGVIATAAAAATATEGECRLYLLSSPQVKSS